MSGHEKKRISDYCLLLNNLYLALYKKEDLFRWADNLEKKVKPKGAYDETEEFLNKSRDAGTPPFLEPSSDLYVNILNLYAGEGNPSKASGNQRLFYIAHLAGWRPEKYTLLDKITALFKDEKRVTKTVQEIRLELARNLAEWVYIKSEKNKHEFLKANEVSWRTDTVGVSEYVVERNKYLINKYCKSCDILRKVIGDFAKNMQDAEKKRTDSDSNDSDSKRNSLFDYHEKVIEKLCECLNTLLLAYDNSTKKDQKEEYLGRCLAWLVLGAMLRDALSCELITNYLEPFIPEKDTIVSAENNNVAGNENAVDRIVDQHDTHSIYYNEKINPNSSINSSAKTGKGSDVYEIDTWIIKEDINSLNRELFRFLQLLRKSYKENPNAPAVKEWIAKTKIQQFSVVEIIEALLRNRLYLTSAAEVFIQISVIYIHSGDKNYIRIARDYLEKAIVFFSSQSVYDERSFQRIIYAKWLIAVTHKQERNYGLANELCEDLIAHINDENKVFGIPYSNSLLLPQRELVVLNREKEMNDYIVFHLDDISIDPKEYFHTQRRLLEFYILNNDFGKAKETVPSLLDSFEKCKNHIDEIYHIGLYQILFEYYTYIGEKETAEKYFIFAMNSAKKNYWKGKENLLTIIKKRFE